EDLDTLTSNDPSPLDELVRRSQREDLVRSLSVTCDPLEQEVVLQVLTGHSNAEIATHLEIKKTHIAVLKHRALTKLRARLEASP
ncbi:MAG: sigma-70 family RNA polymerase sigma factor, partial [Planctomycetes bacterium]|nr:sigma-70 family RNA polymerase sigma factor [Planctomycetota bacterium]